eukprot:s7500_g1.t1
MERLKTCSVGGPQTFRTQSFRSLTCSPHSSAMMLKCALALVGLAQVWAGGHGHEHLAVVRVFSTDEEVMLLNMSKMGKDLSGNSMANEVVMDMVNGFQMKMDMDMYGSTNVTMGTMYDWMECFSAIKSMSAMLNPEQDVYDSNGYTTNKHWVSGPNHVFKKILDAMYMGEYMDMYDSFFLMEMDAVPIKDNWLVQFETEAHEVHDNDQAVRGSQYLGDKWDLFKQMMPVYLVEHINGNAIYNLKNSWCKYLYQAFTMAGDASMMEEMAFDVAFAMMTMAAESGDPMYAANWTGNNMTYNTHTMLVGNYANTLLNTSFEFGSYIRHGSSKNLFENLDDDEVTLGVAYFDHQGHFMETVPTHHPFKKILGVTYFDEPNSTQTISAPGGDVTMKMQPAMYEPYFHLCEIAELVDTTWFALTDNYHIVKAPVSVLMDDDDKPVLPYVLKDSKYCGERPNCKASMEQAEDLFSINLNYHHDKYEVLYKTTDAKMFCAAWVTATEGKGWSNCSLAFGPTADAQMQEELCRSPNTFFSKSYWKRDVDQNCYLPWWNEEQPPKKALLFSGLEDDYIAWKISSPNYNIADEFTPKDKTRYGWRAWTSLWNPAPEYLETLGNISTCAVDYVENATACMADPHCMWRLVA